MRKTFPCGHVGKGQYCHRCRNKEIAQARKVAARVIRRDRESLAEETVGVDLSGVPLKVSEKAAEVIRGIQSGTDYTRYHGKRLYDNRTVISIPLGWSYRMLCRDTGDSLVALSVMSHEDYNRKYKTYT
jgi:hypothetical protein